MSMRAVLLLAIVVLGLPCQADLICGRVVSVADTRWLVWCIDRLNRHLEQSPAPLDEIASCSQISSLGKVVTATAET